jgi:hypothetical protein
MIAFLHGSIKDIKRYYVYFCEKVKGKKKVLLNKKRFCQERFVLKEKQ